MNKVINALGICFIVLFAKILPFNPILGKWHFMFSWISFVAPVTSHHFGFLGTAIGLIFCNKLWLASSMMVLFRKMPLATICAARVFTKREKFLSIIVPIVCIALFVIHPVGNQAWVYSLYWLIPPALWLFSDSVFVRSLQASFVAHGIGSVVWLYAGSLSSPEMWMRLIPLVVFERLLMASGMILCDQLLLALKRLLSSTFSVFCRFMRVI